MHPPDRAGFGSLLLEQVVKDNLAGRVTSDWLPEGLVCVIEIPPTAAELSQAAA